MGEALITNMKKNKSGKIGLIAFANSSGLGAQTRRLAQLIQPDRILVVNSSGFSQNKKQNFDWYKDFEFFVSNGFPSDKDVLAFMQNLTHIFTCENPYNFNMIHWARQKGIKTYCQSNYEFCENLGKHYLPAPDVFLMPSYWKIKEMEEKFGKDSVAYLPPPINPDEFEIPRKINMKRKGKPRFLHIIGTLVTEDRNGTLDLLEAVKLSKEDFELVIHTQHPLPMTYFLDDKRVKYRIEDFVNNYELYKNFDALILPRRFGGLSLTTNEALMSGLPVFMTDISPNNKLLPKDWLIRSEKKGSFMARSKIDLYSIDVKRLAEKIDWLASIGPLTKLLKEKAFKLGKKNFSGEILRPKYEKLFKPF